LQCAKDLPGGDDRDARLTQAVAEIPDATGGELREFEVANALVERFEFGRASLFPFVAPRIRADIVANVPFDHVAVAARHALAAIPSALAIKNTPLAHVRRASESSVPGTSTIPNRHPPTFQTGS